jgi:hypothetical protein
MTHPHQLHVAAALWSLRRARRALTAAVARENASVAISAASTLSSPRYGVRHGTGGHSDPIGDALATAADRADARARQLERLADRTNATLAWIAQHVAPGPGDPLPRLLDAVSGLQPSTAHQVTCWAAEADNRVRHVLYLGPDRMPLVGVPCPYCGTRRLEAQTSPWDRSCWTVVCAVGCTCTGPDCACEMPVKVLGVLHIWAATSSLVVPHLGILGLGLEGT